MSEQPIEPRPNFGDLGSPPRPSYGVAPEAPVSSPEPTPAQVVSPAGETDGYKGPGATLRRSIRDRIAAIAPYTAELVTVEEWDGIQVEVRSLSLGERNGMMSKAMEDGGDLDMTSLYPEITIRTTFDPETGERVFAEDDIEFLNSRPASTVDKIALVAMRLSGMTGSSVDDAAGKSLETAVSEPSS